MVSTPLAATCLLHVLLPLLLRDLQPSTRSDSLIARDTGGRTYGIDAAAHRGALAAGGATVAVLAGGVDRPYPRGHTTLIERIAQQGLVIGELPPGDHPTPSRFILRNRVIWDSVGDDQCD